MVEQNLLFWKTPEKLTVNTKRVDRLTNICYDETSKKADKKIENNNRSQTAECREAMFFLAKEMQS